MTAKSIRKLHWGCVPHRFAPVRLDAKSVLVSVWPAPHDTDECLRLAGFADFADIDDSWEVEWRSIVERAIDRLEACGSPRMRQPVEVREVQSKSWLDILLGRTPTMSAKLSIVDQIILLTQDDRFAPATVDFGEPAAASLCAFAGHAILWITISHDAALDREALLTALADGRPLEKTDLDWKFLVGPTVRCNA